MAEISDITMRSAFTTQALATMGVDPEWDRCLADYLRLEALQMTDMECGAYAAAKEKALVEEYLLHERNGDGCRTRPEFKHDCRQIFEKDDAAYVIWSEAYADPYFQASRDLAQTPAPTLAAALFKVVMICREDLGNDTAMTRNAMEIVAEDLNRFAEQVPV
jgi:hypothetical protein